MKRFARRAPLGSLGIVLAMSGLFVHADGPVHGTVSDERRIGLMFNYQM